MNVDEKQKQPASASASAAPVSGPLASASGAQATLTRVLNELWSSAHIGLSVSVVNGIVAAFVAAPKQLATFRELPLSGDFSGTTVVGQDELWWGDIDGLCSTPLPVLSSPRPVVRRRAMRSDDIIGNTFFDPSIPDRLLVLPLQGLVEYELKTGVWTDVWPALRRQDESSFRRPGVRFGCTDCVGGFYMSPNDHQICRVDRRTLTTTWLAGSGHTPDPADSLDPASASFTGLYCIAAVADGSRLFVGDLQSTDDRRQPPVHSLRRVDLRPGSAKPGVQTLWSNTGFLLAAMCWLPSERLLIADNHGRVHAYDLLSDEKHIVAELPSRGYLSGMCLEERRGHCFADFENAIFELDIRALLPAHTQ
jgi:hypothetical protein